VLDLYFFAKAAYARVLLLHCDKEHLCTKHLPREVAGGAARCLECGNFASMNALVLLPVFSVLKVSIYQAFYTLNA
jgi:hypothetical protein